jgi:hypothetical protein
MDAASMTTLDARNRRVPVVVEYRPVRFVMVDVTTRSRADRVPVVKEPPALLMVVLEAEKEDRLFAVMRFVIERFVIDNDAVVKFVAVRVSTAAVPVLSVLVITVPILIYPGLAARISPVRRIVEAVREEVRNCTVEIVLENVAVFAAIDEIVIDPLGFVMAVEESVSRDAVGATIEPVTLRVLAATVLEAASIDVLMAGTVIPSEKRRSVGLY